MHQAFKNEMIRRMEWLMANVDRWQHLKETDHDGIRELGEAMRGEGLFEGTNYRYVGYFDVWPLLKKARKFAIVKGLIDGARPEPRRRSSPRQHRNYT
jgi:hypothetical protein